MKTTVVTLLSGVSVALASSPPASQARLLKLLGSGSRPADVPVDFDCGWRKLALQYAAKIQPWLDTATQRELSAALELQTLCNHTALFPKASKVRNEAKEKAVKAAVQVYVDAIHGSDDNPGTLQAPLKTLHAALDASRSKRTRKEGASSPASAAATIYLRQGTFFPEQALVLTSEDSGLSMEAYAGEEARVSGGVPLEVQWQVDEPLTSALQARQGKGNGGGLTVYSADLSSFAPLLPNGIPALQLPGDIRATRARFPNSNPETDLFPTGYIMDTTQWGKPEYRGSVCDPSMQCGVSVNVTLPVDDAWHGMYQNYSVGQGGACEVYDPMQSPWCSGDFYLERQFPEMHTRHPSSVSPGALLPNSPYKRPEQAVLHAWRPGHWYSWMFEVASHSVTPPDPNWVVQKGQNNVFGIATSKQDNPLVLYLGTFASSDQCWGACNASMTTKQVKCHSWTWHQPDFPSSDWAGGCYSRLGEGYAPTAEAQVISARGPTNATDVFHFGRGGNQGGEGSDVAAEWFIDNVLEELDAVNEFFYDNATHKLSLIFNGTGKPPTSIAVPSLAVMLEAKGTQEFPVRNVTLKGITFTQNRPTYLDPRGNPSGGDWALEREGAVLLEGTEDFRVSECAFSKLDSNGIMLSGYNRRASVSKCSFSSLGQSAIAAWGRTDYNDGTSGDQPRETIIADNICHDIGLIQKQSSFYFQAVTAQTTLARNIVYNIPRASINFNDGFGGANQLLNNLLFNTCRESSDHGAFNSWDRLPYLTAVGDGKTVSSVPAYNEVHHNFIVANYAADGGCLDNDDGSSYYDIHHNFCVFGGHKSDFDGNNKISRDNLHIYPQVYGSTCLSIGAQNLPPKGYAESYINNTCVLNPSGGAYLNLGGSGLRDGLVCLDGSEASTQAFKNGLKVSSNTLYHDKSQIATVACSDKTVTVEEFHKMGFDLDTTVSTDMPSSDTIIGWAKLLLAV